MKLIQGAGCLLGFYLSINCSNRNTTLCLYVVDDFGNLIDVTRYH